MTHLSILKMLWIGLQWQQYRWHGIDDHIMGYVLKCPRHGLILRKTKKIGDIPGWALERAQRCVYGENLLQGPEYLQPLPVLQCSA